MGVFLWLVREQLASSRFTQPAVSTWRLRTKKKKTFPSGSNALKINSEIIDTFQKHVFKKEKKILSNICHGISKNPAKNVKHETEGGAFRWARGGQ